MNNRDRMIAAIRGLPIDALPWVPRMDLWCIGLRARGALPARFSNLDIVGIADELGVACHAVRGDQTLARRPEDFLLRGLGIENHPDYVYRVEVRDLEVDFRHEDGLFSTTFRTPAGEVTTTFELTAELAREGLSSPVVRSRAIKTPRDLEAVAAVFDHLEVIPTPNGYASFRDRVGERGLAIASGPGSASPMHLILHDLMEMDDFMYLYLDDKPSLTKLAERITPLFEAQLGAMLQCEAEVALWGANYDQNVTWPEFFRDEIVPWVSRVSQRLHAHGKLMLSHADGENDKLLPWLPSCHFDVAESVCPEPMTRRSLAELRAGMGPATTVWGGIASVALLDISMNSAAFERYLDKTFAELGSGERLILGVSDNVPPDADLGRLERIAERVRDFGPVVADGR